MAEKAPENTVEEEEEIEPEEEEEEYDLIEESEPSQKTIIHRKQISGRDYCPFCGAKTLGKDFKQDIYICFKCRQGWRIVG